MARQTITEEVSWCQMYEAAQREILVLNVSNFQKWHTVILLILTAKNKCRAWTLLLRFGLRSPKLGVTSSGSYTLPIFSIIHIPYNDTLTSVLIPTLKKFMTWWFQHNTIKRSHVVRVFLMFVSPSFITITDRKCNNNYISWAVKYINSG